MKHQLNATTNDVGGAAPGCPIERSSTRFLSYGTKAIRRLAGQLEWCVQILVSTLREIFDESAYARFLNQRELVSSRASYAAFRLENEAAKARRPKCC
jgi:hypothetical protein